MNEINVITRQQIIKVEPGSGRIKILNVIGTIRLK